MVKKGYLSTYFHYLVHPFYTHELLLDGESDLRRMTVGESLGLSWIFVIINGVMRIILINFVIMIYLSLYHDTSSIFDVFDNSDRFLGFYFIILSTILDVIFYPLFMLFFIQFWEFVLKVFGGALKVENASDKAAEIMSVAMSSHILTIVPIFGGFAQKFASLILMFAGIKKQLNTSTPMALCILAFPIFIMLGLFCLIMLTYILSLQAV
jgi:hypothetical protein